MQDLLQIWNSYSNYKDKDINKMIFHSNYEQLNDIYFGFCPLYNNKREYIYIFYANVIIDQHDHPILHVTSGACNPSDNSYIPSIQFKNKLNELFNDLLPIIQIDYTELLKNSRFNLSWQYYSQNN